MYSQPMLHKILGTCSAGANDRKWRERCSRRRCVQSKPGAGRRRVHPAWGCYKDRGENTGHLYQVLGKKHSRANRLGIGRGRTRTGALRCSALQLGAAMRPGASCLGRNTWEKTTVLQFFDPYHPPKPLGLVSATPLRKSICAKKYLRNSIPVRTLPRALPALKTSVPSLKSHADLALTARSASHACCRLRAPRLCA